MNLLPEPDHHRQWYVPIDLASGSKSICGQQEKAIEAGKEREQAKVVEHLYS
jgi:hypothetical protein